AREPILTSLNDSLKTNRYWLYSVLSLSARYPLQLQWPKTLISDYKTITVAEVNDLAGKYLQNDLAAVARVSPGETGLGLDDHQPDTTDTSPIVNNAAAGEVQGREQGG
ncbi:MAG: hypothetical protein ACWGOX_05545, partial [Desulforhopalus sp.]